MGVRVDCRPVLPAWAKGKEMGRKGGDIEEGRKKKVNGKGGVRGEGSERESQALHFRGSPT